MQKWAAMSDPSRALQGTVAAMLGTEDPAEADRIAARVSMLAATLPWPVRAGIRSGAGALNMVARALTGSQLDELTPVRREAVCAAVAGHAVGERWLDALKMPLLLAAAESGPEWRRGLPPASDDPPLDCVPSPEWPTCATADAVVVGSGAGGAMVARTLARAGLRVVVVEEGRQHPTAEFREREPLNRWTELYRDGGATVAFGRPPILLPRGRGVGGTTLVNSGTCYRTPAKVLARWRGDFGIEAVERFEDLLDEVERTIQVAVQPLDVLGRNGHLALLGAERLGWQASPLRRNAPGCHGTSQCAVGCPVGAKNGVHLNALPQACSAGARILTQATVDRVLVERGRATGVRALRPDGSWLEILAPTVVVAAGAIETPILLRRSGLGRHPRLGRGLAVHPAVSLAGRFAEPVVAWSGVLQSVGIEQLHDQGILMEATGAPPGMGSFGLPGVGRALRDQLESADHLAFLGAMIADAPSGRVRGSRRALVTYELSDGDAARLRQAFVAIGRVLFAAGAEEVLTGFHRHPVARDVAELADAVAATPTSALHLAAFHPTGTAAMGSDAQRSPVDPSGRLRGVAGVHVADASVLPSCPEVNPQMSIMAMALAVADDVVQGVAAPALARS